MIVPSHKAEDLRIQNISEALALLEVIAKYLRGRDDDESKMRRALDEIKDKAQNAVCPF